MPATLLAGFFSPAVRARRRKKRWRWGQNDRDIFPRVSGKNGHCGRRKWRGTWSSCAHFFALDIVDRAVLVPTFAARMCERWRFMKKSVIKRVVLVAQRQGFRVLYEIENAGVGMCGVLNRALPQKNRKMGLQIRTNMHKTTPFFSAVVPDFFQVWRFFI